MDVLADRLAGSLVTSDDELVREFEARLADSSALAFRVAYSVLRNRQDAEDAAQDAFTRAFRRFRQLRNRDRFRAWLVRMTWRLALDLKRGAGRRLRREDAVACSPRPANDVETEAIATEQSLRLWRAIDALPDKLRMVIVLAAIEGHRIQDVAALLGVPEGTVKSRLFEARRKLQELLR
jgi:RNA polymerase sigma-70 factor (ECF subfamily)